MASAQYFALYLSRLHDGGKNNLVLPPLEELNLSFKSTSEAQLHCKSWT